MCVFAARPCARAALALAFMTGARLTRAILLFPLTPPIPTPRVANDFAFYGNKLFQSSFIAALYPDVSVFGRVSIQFRLVF